MANLRILATLVALLAVGGLVVLYMVPPPAYAQTDPPVIATVAVERAIVFPAPDRNTEPLTYLYERESVPVLGRSPDDVFLLIIVGDVEGWILRAQVDLNADLALVPVSVDATIPASSTLPPGTTPTGATPTGATPTFTPFRASPTPAASPTRVPQTTLDPEAMDELPPVAPGTPPPLNITLPEDWEALHVEVPFEAFSGETHYIPLTIYTGPLADGAQGYIYLYWGFPNVVTMSGEYNLWADGVQLLRGSLVGESCNLGVYEQKTFTIGHLDAAGASYQTSECDGETDTAGWFGVVRVYDGTYAFYTAVEPLEAIADQRPNLQAILDTVEFLPPEED